MQRAGEGRDDIKLRPGYREAKAKRYANTREIACGSFEPQRSAGGASGHSTRSVYCSTAAFLKSPAFTTVNAAGSM